jgi:hypothetical protein
LSFLQLSGKEHLGLSNKFQGGKGIVSPEAKNCNSFKAENVKSRKMFNAEKCSLLKRASARPPEEARGVRLTAYL